MANHASYVNLVRFTKGKDKGRVISNSIELSSETKRQMYQKGKERYQDVHRAKKADVLRPKKGRHGE